MNTNDLIAMLAAEASTTPTVSALRRCVQATAAGVAISLALVLTLWGLNPELNTLTHTQAFWVKVVWLVLTCTFAAPVVMHLARPGVAAGRGVWGIALALVGMALLALMQVATVDADTGMQLMLGSSWQALDAARHGAHTPSASGRKRWLDGGRFGEFGLFPALHRNSLRVCGGLVCSRHCLDDLCWRVAGFTLVALVSHALLIARESRSDKLPNTPQTKKAPCHGAFLLLQVRR
jgi:Negative regulator of sigma F